MCVCVHASVHVCFSTFMFSAPVEPVTLLQKIEIKWLGLSRALSIWTVHRLCIAMGPLHMNTKSPKCLYKWLRWGIRWGIWYLGAITLLG